MTPPSFHGEVAPGFESIVDTMIANLETTESQKSNGERTTDPGDLGAAVCISGPR